MTDKLFAETVAKTCYKLLFDFYETADIKIVQEPVVAIITKALDQFADDKVKEATQCCFDPKSSCSQKAFELNKARAEALEEAACHIENCDPDLAESIRDLKDRKI